MKEYTVSINGIDHTVQLDDEEAKRLGAKAASSKSSTPQNKSRSTSKKG